MKRFFLFFPILLAIETPAQNPVTISEQLLKSYVKYLASDKLKGRGTGTEGERLAAGYITGILDKMGNNIKPGEGGSFLQEVNFKVKKNPHDTVATEERSGRNIVAYLDNGAEKTIVLGAHYDHLGLGEDHNSMDANPLGKIHNGADDNASGAAGLLELVRYFSGNKRKEAFNILFCWFTGEELGLYGSKKFLENTSVDARSVNYMINLDMIGRLNDSTKKLLVYGVGTSPSWVPMLNTMQDYFAFKYDSSGIGPSDHTSFYLKDIPVLFFFTGQHKDYHKPTDDWDKLNYKGEKKVLELVVRVIEETEKMPPLVFTKTKNTETKSSRFRITLGIMPDYAFEGKGVHVDGVTEGKPAAIAGIVKGDIIIQLGDVTVNSMHDYMSALGKFEKGKQTEVKVLRAGKETILKVTF